MHPPFGLDRRLPQHVGLASSDGHLGLLEDALRTTSASPSSAFLALKNDLTVQKTEPSTVVSSAPLHLSSLVLRVLLLQDLVRHQSQPLELPQICRGGYRIGRYIHHAIASIHSLTFLFQLELWHSQFA